MSVYLFCFFTLWLKILTTWSHENAGDSIKSDGSSKDELTTQNSEIRKHSGLGMRDSVEDTEEEEDVKTKNLAKYLGMKDGVSASIASQV